MDQLVVADRAGVAREGDPQPAIRNIAISAGSVRSLLVLLAAAWWLLVATRWWGGRGAGAVSGGAIITAMALVGSRPDRVLPTSAVLTSAALSVGALVVAATAPTGWAGASNAAEYVCVAWTVLCVAAGVVQDRRLVRPLLGLLILGVMFEMEQAWLPWWGSEDPAHPISGTFYWYDPLAAYLIPGTVIGYAVFLRARREIAALGVVGFIFGSIGIAYSTSRAAGVCFVVALVAVSAAHFWRGWDGVRRVVLGLASGGIAVWLISGPPFFPHRGGGVGGSPLAGTVSRAAEQSLSQNGGYRLQFWREALHVFERHPIVGGGFHSLASDSVGHVPSGWALSPLAHSGYLQALSDGGLVLAVPFFVGCVAIIFFVVSALISTVRARDFSIASFAVPLALGAMLAHSAIDFDWTYSADFALVAILAGIVAGARWTGRRRIVDAHRLATCAVLVGVVTLGVSAAAAWSGDLRLSLPVSHHADSGADR